MNDPKKQFLDSLSKEQLRAWRGMQGDEDGRSLFLIAMVFIAGCTTGGFLVQCLYGIFG